MTLRPESGPERRSLRRTLVRLVRQSDVRTSDPSGSGGGNGKGPASPTKRRRDDRERDKERREAHLLRHRWRVKLGAKDAGGETGSEANSAK